MRASRCASSRSRFAGCGPTHLDLWQIHECVYYNDPERHFAKGGVVEALERAKTQGKVRYVGFTGHKDPDIHLRMLALDFPFDACQLPLNGFDASFRSFQARVLPELARRNIAPIGMKSLGGTGRAVKRKAASVSDALRYAMSLPVCTTVSRHRLIESAPSEPQNRARLYADDHTGTSRVRTEPCPARLPTDASSFTRRARSTRGTWAAGSTIFHRRSRNPKTPAVSGADDGSALQPPVRARGARRAGRCCGRRRVLRCDRRAGCSHHASLPSRPPGART